MGRTLFINILSFLSFSAFAVAQENGSRPTISDRCWNALETTEYPALGIQEILNGSDSADSPIRLYYVPRTNYSGTLFTREALVKKTMSEGQPSETAERVNAADLEDVARLAMNESLKQELNTEADIVKNIYLNRELTGTGQLYGPGLYKLFLSLFAAPANLIGNIYGQFNGASWSRAGYATLSGFEGDSGLGQCFVNSNTTEIEGQLNVSVICSPEYMIPWATYGDLLEKLDARAEVINRSCSDEFAAKKIRIESVQNLEINQRCLFDVQSQTMDCNLD